MGKDFKKIHRKTVVINIILVIYCFFVPLLLFNKKFEGFILSKTILSKIFDILFVFFTGSNKIGWSDNLLGYLLGIPFLCVGSWNYYYFRVKKQQGNYKGMAEKERKLGTYVFFIFLVALIIDTVVAGLQIYGLIKGLEDKFFSAEVFSVSILMFFIMLLIFIFILLEKRKERFNKIKHYNR